MTDYIKREDAIDALRECPVTKLKTAIRRHRDEMPIYKENGAVIADKDAVDAWLADPPDWFAACKK